MARNQYAGQVRADGGKEGFSESPVISKPEVAGKRSGSKAGAANTTNSTNPTNSSGATSSSGSTVAPGAAPVAVSDWEMFNTEKPQNESHLKTPAPAAISSSPKVSNAGNANAKPAATFSDPPRAAQKSGGYTLQVIAVRREADALDLAKRLQKKKFPAFVLAPQGNKLYRVQVGPYADQKSAEAAKKGLANAGFRAIVKHG
jgi:cell division septation protein DedD